MKEGCLPERLLSLGTAAVLLGAGMVMAVVASMVVPFIGLIAAGPVLAGSVLLYNRARHGECPL
jgi:hypothetical protein